MEEEEFKKNCPNLYSSMQSKMQWYEVYGMKFKSHTILTKMRIEERAERTNCRYFITMIIENDPKTIFQTTLN
ncbi:MAG: hypothetical protein RLN88_04235 [Ekhidna sp.]|uniref:hypothetical protein n=1 Tax=Ekhidna sp. TaxID=2608089 RepID=UPI0032F05E95